MSALQNSPPSLESFSEKERLLSYGYKEEHIIEYTDGSAILDLERILFDHALSMLKKTLQSQPANTQQKAS